MGYRDSSATLGGGGALRASGKGIGAAPSDHHPKGLSRPARFLLVILHVYQRCFSALMPSACKFYPSCSHYAVDAVRIHGARRGSWLALRRISRCHPFTRGGVDLVPDAADFPREARSSTGFS